METLAVPLETMPGSTLDEISSAIELAIDTTLSVLPAAAQLNQEQQRGIIARYTAVLEGNFIYWMTATYLAVKSAEARMNIVDNLTEEVRDAHPVMLRKFAIAAGAFPGASDALAINDDLNNVRLFLGKLQGVPSLASMAFFEGFIQKFMAYLADLAVAQGSSELEYTDVHGVCDIAHTEGLLKALSAELALSPAQEEAGLLEGVRLIQTLMTNVFQGKSTPEAA